MKKIVKFGVPLVLGGAALFAFLDRWETDHAAPGRVYADKLAGGEPTVCKGITKSVSPYPVIVGDWWSAERCAEVERMAVEKSQLKLLDCFKVRINQGQLDAFSSHAHNFGVGATCASRAVGLTNAGRAVDGCNALSTAPNGRPVWSFVTLADGSKKFVRGLYARRRAETLMCMRGFA